MKMHNDVCFSSSQQWCFPSWTGPLQSLTLIETVQELNIIRCLDGKKVRYNHLFKVCDKLKEAEIDMRIENCKANKLKSNTTKEDLTPKTGL